MKLYHNNYFVGTLLVMLVSKNFLNGPIACIVAQGVFDVSIFIHFVFGRYHVSKFRRTISGKRPQTLQICRTWSVFTDNTMTFRFYSSFSFSLQILGDLHKSLQCSWKIFFNYLTVEKWDNVFVMKFLKWET